MFVQLELNVMTNSFVWCTFKTILNKKTTQDFVFVEFKRITSEFTYISLETIQGDFQLAPSKFLLYPSSFDSSKSSRFNSTMTYCCLVWLQVKEKGQKKQK